MKLKVKILYFFIFNSIIFLNAQKLTLSGVIIEAETLEPIEGVLFVLNDDIIAYTNENGVFNFSLDENNSEKEIILTHLSYKSKLIKISDFKDNMKIQLEGNLTVLGEVFLVAKKGLSKKEIIKRAVDNYKNKIRKDPFWSSVNLKQMVSYQDTNQSYLEIDGTIFMVTKHDDIWRDPVIIPLKTRRTKEAFTPLFYRKSRWQNESSHIGMSSIPESFFKYRFFERVHPLSKKGFKHFDFTIEKTTSIDNETCYLINYKERKPISFEGRSFDFMRGQLWVTKDSLKLKKITTSFRFSLYRVEKGADCIFTVNYQDEDDITYPKNIFYNINYDSNIKSRKTALKDVYNVKGALTFIKIDKTPRLNYLSGITYSRFSFLWSNVHNDYDKAYWDKKDVEETPFDYNFNKWTKNKTSDILFKEGALQKRELKQNNEIIREEELKLMEYMKRDLKTD